MQSECTICEFKNEIDNKEKMSIKCVNCKALLNLNVKKYDYSKTEHSYIRDWARDYLPYHDKDGNELPDKEWIKGTLISLNVECIKLK